MAADAAAPQFTESGFASVPLIEPATAARSGCGRAAPHTARSHARCSSSFEPHADCRPVFRSV